MKRAISIMAVAILAVVAPIAIAPVLAAEDSIRLKYLEETKSTRSGYAEEKFIFFEMDRGAETGTFTTEVDEEGLCMRAGAIKFVYQGRTVVRQMGECWNQSRGTKLSLTALSEGTSVVTGRWLVPEK